MVELTLEKAILIAISLTIAALIGIPLLIRSLSLLNELVNIETFIINVMTSP